MQHELFMRRIGGDPHGGVWSIYGGGEIVGAMNHFPLHPSEKDWGWTITVISGDRSLARAGRAETMDGAQAGFRAAWTVFRAALGEDGWARHVADRRDSERRVRYFEEVQRRRLRGDLSFPPRDL